MGRRKGQKEKGEEGEKRIVEKGGIWRERKKGERKEERGEKMG